MMRGLILLGLTSLVSQVLMLRELAVALRGNELILGATLAVWMLLTAAGSGLLGPFADRLRDPRGVFLGGLGVAGLLTPLCVVAVRLAGPWLFGPAEMLTPVERALLGTTATLAPLGLTLGFLFTVGCRSAAQGGPAAIASVYAVEAVGAVLGGIIFTYLAAGRAGNLECAFGLAVVNALGAFGIWASGPRRRAYGWLLGLLAAFALAFVVTPMAGALDLATQGTRYPGEVLRWSRDSRYGHVDVTARGGQFNFYHDRVPAGSTHNDEAAEPLAYAPLLAHEKPSRALLIGGSGAAMARKVLEHPGVRLDLVELDPLMIEAAHLFGEKPDRKALGDASRVRAVGDMDGRLWLKRSPAAYDVIICCLPDPGAVMLNRFYTAEFFREARRGLRPGGILATQISSSPSQMSAPLRHLSASHLRTLRGVFAHVAVVPLDWANLFLASDRPLMTAPDAIVKRLAERRLEPRLFIPGVAAYTFRPDRQAAMLRAISTEPAARANTDLWPVSTYFALLQWGAVEGAWWSALLAHASRVRMPHVVGLAALAGALTLGAACFRRRPSALVAPATLAASGWAGITLEVVILFAFQGLYGYVYEQLGVLFAAFMVGLAAGCYLAAPRATAGDRLMGLTMAQALLALLAATMPMLFQRFAAAGIGGMGETVGLAALNLVVGGLTGYQFPLAAAVVIEDPSHAAGRSGLVYGLDLAGSSLGALVSGALLIPVLGLASTCSAVSVVMVVCAACQFVAMGLEAERAAAGRITLPPAPPTRPTPPSA